MSVLVLQNSGAARDHLVSSLEEHGFQPVSTLGSASGLSAVMANQAGLRAVLVNLALAESPSICRQIRAADPALPLLVVFDDDSAAHLEGALAAGATGCIPEPVNPLELAAKVRAAVRQYSQTLPPEVEQNPPAADPLTGLATDRGFRANLQRAWRRERRSRTPLSLLLMNIDYFAPFNQLYGHDAGDNCLRRIAETIQSALYRPDDFAAHLGAGEFAVLLPGTDRAGASVVAERLRAKVMELAIPHAGSSAASHVTISLGAAGTTPNADLALDDLVTLAERALSEAKLRGRNQLVVLQEEPAVWLA